jgi:site-specific DNA-methyltransferase (adenine-specific)
MLPTACDRTIGDFPCCSVVTGDCLELMKRLPDGSVDAVITSPLYNLGGFHQMHGGNSAKWSYASTDDWKPEQDYQREQIDLCNRLYDLGAKYLFYSHKNRIVDGAMISPLYWLVQTKWTVHQSIVVNKGSGANVDKRRFFPVHEHVYVCFRSPAGRLNNAANLTDVWFVGDEQTNRKEIGHPAVMPESVATNCVSTTDAQTILDPFCGSGTTLVAAKRLGRHFLGFEISETYCEIARERLARIDAQPNLFPAPLPEQMEMPK